MVVNVVSKVGAAESMGIFKVYMEHFDQRVDFKNVFLCV